MVFNTNCVGQLRVKKNAHAHIVRRPKHRLYMRLRVAVDGSTHQLRVAIESVEEYVGPTGRVIHRQERSPDAGIHRDEAFVLLPKIVLTQDLAHTAEIETFVLSFNHPHIFKARNQFSDARLTVQDENKVGLGVEALAQEKFKVRTCCIRLCIGVQYEWSFFGDICRRRIRERLRAQRVNHEFVKLQPEVDKPWRWSTTYFDHPVSLRRDEPGHSQEQS